MTRFHRFVLRAILTSLLCGLPGGLAVAMETSSFAGTVPAGYCLLSTGDLNGDSIGDFAISKKAGGTTETTIAYLFYSRLETTPAFSETQDLDSQATYILHGKAAEPFACYPPSDVTTINQTTTKTIQVARNTLSTSSMSSSTVTQPVYYSMVDINQSNNIDYSYAYGLNDRGQVVGNFLNSQREEHAYFFDGWIMHDLGTLGGHFSIAYDINAPGKIVGYSLTGETDTLGWVHQAFRSDGFSMQGMGSKWCSANAVNNAGQAVGEMIVASGAHHANIYKNQTITDLGTLDGLSSFALGINNSGHVVGKADSFVLETGQPAIHAFLYSNGQMQDLGSLGYACLTDDSGRKDCYERSIANDINSRRQIAGISTTASGQTHAFLMTKGSMVDLGTLGGRQSWAQAINDSGQVVGTSLNQNDTAYHAFLYDKGTMYDLNQLIIEPADHPIMWGAQDINNFGQIVGVNYLLNPIYEKVTSKKNFKYRHIIGKKLSFEYWGKADVPPFCQSEQNTLQLQVKIVVDDQATSSTKLNRWITVGNVPVGCDIIEGWHRASLSLPKVVQGKAATIKIRIKKAGMLPESTVYLRHFRMKQDPT
jgi:probable HAF family extracellular repeat protein